MHLPSKHKRNTLFLSLDRITCFSDYQEWINTLEKGKKITVKWLEKFNMQFKIKS